MKLRQFMTVGVSAVLVVQLSACAYLPEGTSKVLGAVTGGVIGDKLGEHAGVLRPVIAAAGALIGAELGQRLGKYLSEQDQKKWQEQVNTQAQDPKPQTFVTCTNDQSPYLKVSTQEAKSKNCGKENKVISTSSATTSVGGQECKTMQTEIADTQKPLDTINYQICKGPDGAWHGKSA